MRDVNDTGFKLVLGRSDWRTQFDVEATSTDDSSADVVYDTENQCATLRPRPFRFRQPATEANLRPSDRASAARDRYGSWYWIDPATRKRIVVRSAGDGTVATFWSTETDAGSAAPERQQGQRADVFQPVENAEPSGLQRLGALTITRDHRLVVAATSPDQLLVFDLHGGGPPHRIRWYGEGGFEPVDATPRPDGGVYLLDEAGEDGPQLWTLDRTFRPVGPVESMAPAPVFHPVSGKEEQTEPPSPRSGGPVPLPGGIRPEVIEALPDDTLLVLSVTTDDEGGKSSTLCRFHIADTDAEPEDVPDVNLNALLKAEHSKDEWSSWRAHDIAFVPGSPDPTEAFRGTLYVVGEEGNQAYEVHLAGDTSKVTAQLRRQYIPLRRFSGKGLVAAKDRVYYDMEDRWLPLTAQHRPRFVDHGRIESGRFDSEIAACTWHRVFLDACLPTETTVRVESRASDHASRLTDQPWQPEPDLYRRSTGSEIPYYDAFSSDDSERQARGTWELLLQHAEGRYLQLRLTLEGNERSAPRLYALRIYAPRFSYLDQYMPDLYQEDEASARFLERFMANAEGMLTGIEGRIAAAQTLFDVRTVPDEYLDWLGTWFSASFDPALDRRRKRLFLKHAVDLYNQRGTLAGLARMLALVLDPCVDESLFTPAGIASAIGRPGDADERRTRRGGVRLVESFAARGVPRAALGDATVPEQPVEVRAGQPWTFEDGADVLHQRFRTYLDTRRTRADGEDKVWERTAFPPLLPSAGEEAGNGDAAQKRRDDWRLFVRRVIDGPYAPIDAGNVRSKAGDKADTVTRRFRAFLQRRYRTVDRLKAKWSTHAFDLSTVTSFEQIQLPRELPTGKALRDWMHFVGAVLPMHRAAHRFRVLVPVDPDADAAVQRQRLDIARRVVERERPAHTAFEILPYWAAFRVGVVRTGLDTVLGTGSRYAPLLLGEGVLAEEVIGAEHPANVAERRVTGRDAAGAPRPL